MTAILGFGGIRFDGNVLSVNPKLPSQWETLEFKLVLKEQITSIFINKIRVTLTSEKGNSSDLKFNIGRKSTTCMVGQSISILI